MVVVGLASSSVGSSCSLPSSSFSSSLLSSSPRSSLSSSLFHLYLLPSLESSQRAQSVPVPLVTKSDHWSRMVVFALFGVIFGGLHCIGWYFEYPTHSEQTLWRATSLAITVIPLIVAPIDFLLATRDIGSCQKFERRALLILDLIITILLFVYVPARLSLIAQALALLRNQPSSAPVAVDWTKYVPHLFS